jgi:hypothetical protein
MNDLRAFEAEMLRIADHAVIETRANARITSA